MHGIQHCDYGKREQWSITVDMSTEGSYVGSTTMVHRKKPLECRNNVPTFFAHFVCPYNMAVAIRSS